MGLYSIYNMIDRNVSVKIKGNEVSGVCDNVRRDVLDNEIFVSINGKEYKFIEPHKIEEEQNQIVFVYGSEQTEDLYEFCGEEFSVHWGEDIRKSIGREKSYLRTVFILS